MSIAATADINAMPSHPLLLRLAVAAACAAVADWLFFGWDIGISLALFFGLLGISAVVCNGIHAPRSVQIVISAVFIAGLLALIEDVNLLSAAMATLAMATFVMVMTAREPASWQRYLFEATTFPVRGPFQLIMDVTGALRHMKRPTAGLLEWLVAWIVPLGIFAIFLGLLASANPLIENGLKWIDPRYVLEFFESWRLAFWIAAFSAVWPLLHRRIRRRPAPRRDSAGIEPAEVDHLFGEKAMSRSLILFNLLFALQSGLDLTYLWAGARLPDGMSHAAYAHRGAYPLIVTALLAAVFVLIAMRPGGPAKNSRLIRPLVLTWIAQNILLVISSMLRLDLYIAAFSLTYLRLAAFIWMALVAIGLALILTQIVGRKSNAWLLSANAISLMLVLYGCCFLNAPWLVATYNVKHCREVTGTGPNLDMAYLTSLGSAQTLPPIEAHLAQFPNTRSLSIEYRTSPDRNYLARPGNWRAWGFRTWRLERYFANTPGQPYISSIKTKAGTPMVHSILVVDDDPHIRDVVRFAFEKTGMKISTAQDGKEALRQFDRNIHELVVLDIGMPEMDGLEVCRQIRKTSDTPILFLSARDEEIDRVLGLEIGGDDYVTKPFSPRELVARVNAILRRTKGAPSTPETKTRSHGGLVIDSDAHTAVFAGQPVSLTALEFAILRTLLARPSFVFTRDLILDAAYAGNIHVADRTIDSHVRNIRAKMSAAGCDSVIETVHGVGFKLGRCEAAR